MIRIWQISTLCFFFFNDTATTEIYTLSLHDALPISRPPRPPGDAGYDGATPLPVPAVLHVPRLHLRGIPGDRARAVRCMRSVLRSLLRQPVLPASSVPRLRHPERRRPDERDGTVARSCPLREQRRNRRPPQERAARVQASERADPSPGRGPGPDPGAGHAARSGVRDGRRAAGASAPGARCGSGGAADAVTERAE